MTARRLVLAAIILSGVPGANAQNSTPHPQPNPVLEVIRKFQGPATGKSATTNATAPATADAAAPAAAADLPAATREPVGGQALAPPAGPPTPHPGLAVRVEKLQTGTGEMDPSQVKLLFAFPAKPLAPTPAGWCLKSSSSAPPFTREIELSPGNKITLTIRPDILVPDADGAAVFSVPEPGFDAALGYRQCATIGIILSRSVHQLDHDSIKLGAAIDKLQQILVSLPKPEPTAIPAPEPPPDPQTDPKTKPAPTRKK